jgi:hypothetical protein
MPGRKKLRRIQWALESTPGTPVATTWRYRGPAVTLDDNRPWEFVEEDIGILGGDDRKVLPYADGALALPDCPLTPEDFPYFLATSLGGPITGSADGAGSTGFRYVTTIPTTAAPTNNRAMTVETGDDFEVERAAYGKHTEWSVKGVQKKPVMLGGKMQTQPVARLGAAFSATSIVTRNDLIFAGCRLYLDAVAGTIGTTQITGQFLGFEVALKPKWVFKQTGEGAAAGAVPSYNLVVYVDHEITGKITLEHDPAADGSTGLKALFRAGTQRLMRIDCLGQTYATPGSGTLFTGGRRGVRFDLPITITKAPPLDEIDGNDIVTFEWASRYNATFASAGSITVCNEVSALP